MNTQQLRQKILGLAIRGKLVTQDPNDEPATRLLARINPKAHPITDNLPFQVPENWCWTKIKDIATLYSGQDFPPSKFNTNKEGIPYLTGASNIEGNKLIENRWTTNPSVIAEQGDLLVVCKGAGVGKMVIMGLPKAHIARQFQAIRSKEVHTKYIECVLKSSIKNILQGANGLIPGLGRQVILEFMLPLPPLSEQRRIVAAVEEYFHWIDIIEQNQSRMQATIDKAKAKILDLAVNGELVKKNEEWRETSLGEIGIWQAGGTPDRKNKKYYGGNIPWLKTGDLNDGFIRNIPEHITEEGLTHSTARLMPKDSVLIAMYGATIGKLGILTFPATTNQACCACYNYQDRIERDYLFFFLMSYKNNFIAMGGGGAQPNISKSKIIGVKLSLPPLSVQQEIVSRVKSLFSVLDRIAAAV